MQELVLVIKFPLLIIFISLLELHVDTERKGNSILKLLFSLSLILF